MKFHGRYEYTIDPKGRINIPADFRALLQESGDDSLVVTNYENCLYCYSSEGWAQVEERLSKLPSADPDYNDFLRIFIGGSVVLVPDKQGRVLLPPTLRAYAGLEKDIIINGMLKRFEIWSADRWQEVFGRHEKRRREDPAVAKKISDIEF